MKAISLFACGGIGDLGLHHAGFEVLVANELLTDRAEVFKYNYPETQMIIGDIWKKREDILKATTLALKGEPLDVVFATPPCQGMSKNGRGKLLSLIRQGLKNSVDERNLLIIPSLDIFLKSGAHTLVLENVPEMENTLIPHPQNGDKPIGIIDLIKESLGPEYSSSVKVVEFANYGIPQSRQRLISIFTKNERLKNHLKIFGSLLPQETHSKDGIDKRRWITVRDTIGDEPPLDAGSAELASCNSIPYHRVPLLDAEKYTWVRHAKKERSAFDNQCINSTCLFNKNPTHSSAKDGNGINRASTETPIFCLKCGQLLPRPWVIELGEYRLMKGYTSAYKRMSWDAPASTLTRNLSYACSDNKLHPSQNRVLSLHEAMKLHTLSNYHFQWKRNDGKTVSDKLIRELIGESIPPAGLEIIFKFLANIMRGEPQKIETSTATRQEYLF